LILYIVQLAEQTANDIKISRGKPLRNYALLLGFQSCLKRRNTGHRL